MLPSQSAEFGFDAPVQATVKALFGIDPTQAAPTAVLIQKANAKGGQAVFIPQANASNLAETFEKLNLAPDLRFDKNRATDRPTPTSGQGALSYLHKKKEGRDIYFFANSSDEAVQTTVELLGKLTLERYNPDDGSVTALPNAQVLTKNGQVYTRVPLALAPVKSVFIVGKSN